MAPMFPAIAPPYINPTHYHHSFHTPQIHFCHNTRAAMVVSLGPGKFYGSSLPRPRFYTDVKHSDERVDPPLSVMDPLMTWAHDAHWSMGGQSFTRYRLQGRIEGNVEKLRAQREKQFKDKSKKPDKRKRIISETPSPPPVAIKRRRVVGLVDEVEEDLEEVSVKRGAVRKLSDDFERVAKERKRDLGEIKKKLVKGGRKVESVAAAAAAAVGTRSSPRLAKREIINVFDDLFV